MQVACAYLQAVQVGEIQGLKDAVKKVENLSLLKCSF